MKKAPKRKESKDLIACMYEDFKKKQQEIQDTKNNLLESSPEGLFFEHCAKRMKSLQDNVKGALQIQIQQLFFNAENPDAPPTSSAKKASTRASGCGIPGVFISYGST